MSKKKKFGIAFGVMLIVFFVFMLTVPIDRIIDFDALDAREKYGDNIELATDSFGNICASTQIVSSNAGNTWTCDYSLTAKTLNPDKGKNYEKDVWKIKVNHYNNLILFKDGSFDCKWINEKISEIRSTSKSNWSPLDQRQWNQMQTDYIQTRNEMCSDLEKGVLINP